jgi:hypothetical protein
MDILINLLIEEERKRKRREVEAEVQRPQLQLELPIYDPYMHPPKNENENLDDEEEGKRGVIIIEL